MSHRIHQLPPNVVTKIAAGEVIERPASVVKELLENSIDAGSTRIDVDLEHGGIELIRVVDDGYGIAADDLPLAFASHATSKLRSAEDLFAINTMGFRGEALASIAGIAQVTLQSRPQDQLRGAELQCDGGILAAVRPWNGSPGTRIEVRHLFYNVPVRRKFLKSVATELGQVCETVTRLALAKPSLHLTLRHNGRLVYDIPATANLADRIGLFFTTEVRDALYSIDSGPGPLRLTGFIADPKCDRGNAKLQYLFVNGRWFRDRSLAHALQEAYRGLLMTGRYAVGFLYLDVPPDRVDVNVHPTKAEVRFQENSLVYSLVRSTVKARLLRENLTPNVELSGTASSPSAHQQSREDDPLKPEPLWSQVESRFEATGRDDITPSLPQFSPRHGVADRVVAPWESEPAAPLPVLPPEQSHLRHRIAVESAGHPGAIEPQHTFSRAATGTALQVHEAYLVLESQDGMLVIDQHALHERILFEQFRRRIREGKLEVQRLLIPEPIDLPADQAAIVLEAADTLRELGLEVSDFGGNTILLSSYPTLLTRKPPHEIFRAVVDELVTNERAPTRDMLLYHLIATMACKAAVKAGDKLSSEEIDYLLRLRELAEDSHHCPHGRPTSLVFSRHELDKHFRRI